jgi:hypothetical protein
LLDRHADELDDRIAKLVATRTDLERVEQSASQLVTDAQLATGGR